MITARHFAQGVDGDDPDAISCFICSPPLESIRSTSRISGIHAHGLRLPGVAKTPHKSNMVLQLHENLSEEYDVTSLEFIITMSISIIVFSASSFLLGFFSVYFFKLSLEMFGILLSLSLS